MTVSIKENRVSHTGSPGILLQFTKIQLYNFKEVHLLLSRTLQ